MKTGRKQNTEILTLIFDAGLWSRTDAVEFAGANGFKFGELIENEGEILLPQKAIETFAAGDDYTTEERKVMAETRKILGADEEELGISATCARVPVTALGPVGLVRYLLVQSGPVTRNLGEWQHLGLGSRDGVAMLGSTQSVMPSRRVRVTPGTR